MSPEISLDIAVQRIRQWAATKSHIASVYLYGSRVRGDAREDSDLDIAVEFKISDEGWVTASGIFEFETWRLELERLLPWPVHLDVYHKEAAPRVWGYVQNGGLQIFEVDPATNKMKS